MNTDGKLFSEKLVTPIHLPIDIDLCVCVIFWLCCRACGILVPQPGIRPAAPALAV